MPLMKAFQTSFARGSNVLVHRHLVFADPFDGTLVELAFELRCRGVDAASSISPSFA